MKKQLEKRFDRALILFTQIITKASFQRKLKAHLLNHKSEPAKYFTFGWSLVSNTKNSPILYSGTRTVFLCQTPISKAFEVRADTSAEVLGLHQIIYKQAVLDKQMITRSIIGVNPTSKSILHHIFDCCLAREVLDFSTDVSMFSEEENLFLKFCTEQLVIKKFKKQERVLI